MIGKWGFQQKKLCESCMSGLGVQKQPKNGQKTCFSAINWSQMVKWCHATTNTHTSHIFLHHNISSTSERGGFSIQCPRGPHQVRPICPAQHQFIFKIQDILVNVGEDIVVQSNLSTSTTNADCRCFNARQCICTNRLRKGQWNIFFDLEVLVENRFESTTDSSH